MADDKPESNADPRDAERAQKLKEAAVGAMWLKPIERDMLAYLMARPKGTWCPGCDRILNELHRRATR